MTSIDDFTRDVAAIERTIVRHGYVIDTLSKSITKPCKETLRDYTEERDALLGALRDMKARQLASRARSA